MGVKNYLIEGVSGSGKTAVCNELQRRGYHAINCDRELAYLGDPETGEPAGDLTQEPSATFRSEHHIWDVEKVKSLVANQHGWVTFFCGHSRNSSKFIDLLMAFLSLRLTLTP
jgi:broad-specificity NMP kinase